MDGRVALEIQHKKYVGHNNKRVPLYINDLGVIFTTNLKWKNQVITATNKANQMLGRIKKSKIHSI